MPQPSRSPAPAAGHHRPPHRAPGGQRQKRDAPRGDAREVTVGRHRDPDGRRRHRDERRREPGRVLVRQGARGHHDRGRGAGADEQTQQPRPRAAAQSDAVEPDERQQRARRMARHMRDPRIRLKIRDSAGECAHRFGNVGDGRHLPQVFMAGGEPAGEAALPAVDHGKRECPRARGGPGDPRQRTPRQAERDRLAPHHRGDADDDRRDGAPADMGVPPSEDRRRVGEVVKPLGRRVDQRRDDAQVQMRHHERRDHQERADGDRHRLPATDPHARQPIGLGSAAHYR